MRSNDIVLMVSIQDVFKYAGLNGNIDPDILNPYIKAAQDVEVQSILGTKLYRALLTKIETSTLTGNYQTLVLEYIQPMLIQYAMADFIQYHGFEVTNAGVVRNVPINTQLPELSELDVLVKRRRRYAEKYRDLCVGYLCENTSLFPEYNDGQEGQEYPNSSSNNYTGWNLP